MTQISIIANTPKTMVMVPAVTPAKPLMRADRDRGKQGKPRRIFEYDIEREIDAGGDPILFPPELILLLLKKGTITEAAFNQKLGCGPTYFESDIFNTRHNDGIGELPKPLQQKMAALTGTEVKFWQKCNYRASEANG